MTQEERWQQNYEKEKNLSKYDLTERRLFTWLKHNRKQMNQGLLKEPRFSQFKELLELCEQYRRKNQYQ